MEMEKYHMQSLLEKLMDTKNPMEWSRRRRNCSRRKSLRRQMLWIRLSSRIRIKT